MKQKILNIINELKLEYDFYSEKPHDGIFRNDDSDIIIDIKNDTKYQSILKQKLIMKLNILNIKYKLSYVPPDPYFQAEFCRLKIWF